MVRRVELPGNESTSVCLNLVLADLINYQNNNYLVMPECWDLIFKNLLRL